MDDMFTWRSHIEMIVPKLSATSFTISVAKTYMTYDSLKLINTSYFHSIIQLFIHLFMFI